MSERLTVKQALRHRIQVQESAYLELSGRMDEVCKENEKLRAELNALRNPLQGALASRGAHDTVNAPPNS